MVDLVDGKEGNARGLQGSLIVWRLVGEVVKNIAVSWLTVGRSFGLLHAEGLL